MDASLAQGEEALACGEAEDALQIFSVAYSAATAAGDQAAAALAMLGRAQAEFAMRRLPVAADHAADACERLEALGLPQARHAADLVIQIEHNRHLA